MVERRRSEWRAYPALLRYWKGRGFAAAASVRDPGRSRVEFDVVAWERGGAEVRITEMKERATGALVNQAFDRLRWCPLVYAAVPGAETERLLGRLGDARGLHVGVLAVQGGVVREVRAATPHTDLVDGSRAALLARMVRGLDAEGRG